MIDSKELRELQIQFEKNRVDLLNELPNAEGRIPRKVFDEINEYFNYVIISKRVKSSAEIVQFLKADREVWEAEYIDRNKPPAYPLKGLTIAQTKDVLLFEPLLNIALIDTVLASNFIKRKKDQPKYSYKYLGPESQYKEFIDSIQPFFIDGLHELFKGRNLNDIQPVKLHSNTTIAELVFLITGLEDHGIIEKRGTRRDWIKMANCFLGPNGESLNRNSLKTILGDISINLNEEKQSRIIKVINENK